MRYLILPVLLLLAACAPDQPSNADARQAMVERMEASTKASVTGVQVYALDLSGCVPAAGAEGVVCQVALDVGFESQGVQQRSDDTGPMRFVREGEWKAYPVRD
ncbi:hypothetical protein [Arenimonas daejeonensis]|uniref:hypothetical protein n=1 Tax=Arenimonas daejeonensis TaxID=370777 RepID=UPI0011BE79B3|nr:hypothetical protein [Arenimonas daejeonensis]